jgi:hypothetical protein
VAYFHARYTPRGPAGNLRRGLRYYTFREEPAHPRGRPRVWHSDDGRALDYTAAKAEIPAGAQEALYTYRLVLSTKDAPLTPADYAAVLDRGGFDRWYFTAHHGGDHPHAHGVAFATRRRGRDELNAVRAALGTRERARERTRCQDAESPTPARVPRAPQRTQELELW